MDETEKHSEFDSETESVAHDFEIIDDVPARLYSPAGVVPLADTEAPIALDSVSNLSHSNSINEVEDGHSSTDENTSNSESNLLPQSEQISQYRDLNQNLSELGEKSNNYDES